MLRLDASAPDSVSTRHPLRYTETPSTAGIAPSRFRFRRIPLSRFTPSKGWIARMQSLRRNVLAVAAVLVACAIAWPASAQGVARLIVKFTDVPAKMSLPTAERLARLSADLAQLRGSADVEYAEPDLPRHASKIANDEFRFAQEYLDEVPAGISASRAWDVTTDSAATVVCNATAQNNPDFVPEDPAFMPMTLPTAGVCPAATTPVYPVFGNRIDANHRCMGDRAVRARRVAPGWLAEGDGPDLVVICARGS
jgi:hypothetical protein